MQNSSEQKGEGQRKVSILCYNLFYSLTSIQTQLELLVKSWLDHDKAG